MRHSVAPLHVGQGRRYLGLELLRNDYFSCFSFFRSCARAKISLAGSCALTPPGGNPAEQVNAFVTLAYVLLLGGVVGPNALSIIATA
jgi:hypothetical protein